ncbi:MAG: hypothetical protein ACFFAK_17655, partial [Promethearchaeota archaeon]
ASLEDLFISLIASSEDLHLEPSGHSALDTGTDLSASFTDDIDGETRPTGANSWDIGADEYVAPLTSLYRSVGIRGGALATGGASGTQAITIQRGTSTIGNAGGTDSPGAPFGSTLSTFVLNQSNRYTNSGRTTLGSIDSEIDDLSGGIALTGTDTISFYREAASEAADYTFHWEAWEYIGPPGGANEFIVRDRRAVTLTSATATSYTPAGVSNPDNCIPFITGIRSNQSSNSADNATAIAWVDDSGDVQVRRGGTNGTTTVYIVLVEFTGSNWTVLHGTATDINDTGTITLDTDSDGAGGSTGDVNDWSNALIFHQFYKGPVESTTDAIADTSAVYSPTAGQTTQVDWAFHSDHVENAGQQHFVHVLKNPGMTVARYSVYGGSVQAEGDNLISITEIADLTNTVCVGSAYSSGTGAAYSRGWKGIFLTSTTDVNAWASRSGNTISVEVQVAEMPLDAAGTPNELVISGSTATFGAALADTIGVGDVIQYDSDDNGSIDTLAFIHGRTSSTVYTVKDKNGYAPTPVTSDYDWAIYRAYTSLANWESQTENPNITEPVEDDVNPNPNLVSANTVMMVACYGDGEDATSAYINSWTTGPDNYIKIYTPVSPSEVGTSQRHNGAWDTSAYRISQDGGYFAPIGIRERYVRIDGLQIESNKEVGGESNGIHVSDDNSDAPVEIHISNSIFRMTVASPSTAAFGIGALNGFGDVTLDNSLYVAKLWNNIIYGYTAAGGTKGTSMYAQGYGTVYAYNNTCVGGSGAAKGIAVYDNVDFYAKNNISIDSTDPYSGTFHANSTNNVSDTGDAPGSNPINGEPTFFDKVGNDYHLDNSDTIAKDTGANLSSDSNLLFSTDIDGETRPPGAGLWDVGADEFGIVVTLSEANAGQITNQFDGSPSQEDALLYRLRLYNNSDAAATVDKVVLHLTGISGILAGDLSDLRIRVGAGPTGTTVSSAPTVDIAGDTGTITFDGDFSLSGNFGTDYFVSGDLANLASPDTLTISLARSDVTLVSG